MVRILALCHGRNLDNPPGTTCYTSLVSIKSATFLDKDKNINPHILQDLNKPFHSKIKYDVITTVCCDSDAFFDDAIKSIKVQAFKNIASALKVSGVFLFPKYYWVNSKHLSSIQRYLTCIDYFKMKNEHYYIFTKKCLKPDKNFSSKIEKTHPTL